MILFNCIPFSKLELLLKDRICSQREQILSFKSSSIWYGKSLLIRKWPPLNVTIFITHMCNCVMTARPMHMIKTRTLLLFQLRSRLVSLHPQNYANLEEIQKCVFTVILDDASPTDESDVSVISTCVEF